MSMELSEKSKVSLDIKAVIGAVAGIISIASVGSLYGSNSSNCN